MFWTSCFEVKAGSLESNSRISTEENSKPPFFLKKLKKGLPLQKKPVFCLNKDKTGPVEDPLTQKMWKFQTDPLTWVWSWLAPVPSIAVCSSQSFWE